MSREVALTTSVIAALLLAVGCASGDQPETATSPSPVVSPTLTATPIPTSTPTSADDASDDGVDLDEVIGPCAGAEVSDEIDRVQEAYYAANTEEGDDLEVYNDSLEHALEVQGAHFDAADKIREAYDDDVEALYCHHWLDEDDWTKAESQALADELIDEGPGPRYEEAEARYGE